MQTSKSGLHILLIADILRQLVTNLIPTVSGGAYQDIRKVTTEWNARLKHCGPLKIRGSMHPASPSTLFSPIFSLAREKMGPPEARQKRPRRNESLQARLLILCARFFLSKPQTEFAVWVFPMQICDNLSGASFMPLLVRQLPWKGSLGFSVFLSSISPSLRFCGKTPAAARRAGRGRRLRRAGPRRR